MDKLTGSAIVSVVLWIASVGCLLVGQAGAHPNGYRFLLSIAVGATAIAAVDRHRAQLAEIAAISYRAGTAAGRREMRLVGGEMPTEPRGQVVA